MANFRVMMIVMLSDEFGHRYKGDGCTEGTEETDTSIEDVIILNISIGG